MGHGHQDKLGLPSDTVVDGHKMYIFIINIPTFHSIYGKYMFITNEFNEFC
jgi:hypothetical protein